MKTFKSLFAAAMLVAMVMIGGLQQANASSPLRFGLKAGVNMNEQ
jgi:hypothetical protein